MAILELILLVYLLFSLAGLAIEIIPAIVILPAAPFACAKEIMKEHPMMAWLIIAIWGSLYAIALAALLISAMS